MLEAQPATKVGCARAFAARPHSCQPDGTTASGVRAMSTMTLFHAPASPFVRKVRVLLHETGQQDRVALHEVQTSPVEPSPELLAGNPAGKIPALRLAD